PAAGTGELSGLHLVEQAAPGGDHAAAVGAGGRPRVRHGAWSSCMDGAPLRVALGSEQSRHAAPAAGEGAPGVWAVGVACPEAGPAAVAHARGDVLAAKAGGHGGPEDGPAGF